MKNNIFILIAAIVIFSLVLVGATLVYLSKTSEYSRASDAPTTTSP